MIISDIGLPSLAFSNKHKKACLQLLVFPGCAMRLTF